MAVEIFEMRAIDFWRDVLELVCGKGHGLRVAVYSSGDDECVEILGQLPATLKRGLRQAVLWNEPLKLGAKRVGRGQFTWTPRLDAGGRSYAVPSMDALISLLDARRELLAGGGA